MNVLAAGGLTPGTLLKVVVSALAAGVGVTVAFAALIYCSERAIELRRAERDGAALAFSAGAALALALCIALVVAGLVLVASKPK